MPVKALSEIYRAKFKDAMQQAGLRNRIDPAAWKQPWVVHSRAVGDGRASLAYLAPYVFRVAISDRRIISHDDKSATFSYRKSGSNRWRRMTLDAMEFLRRFLQHVLPRGFQKVRHYGFLSPNAGPSIESIRWLVFVQPGQIYRMLWTTQYVAPIPPRVRCPACGQALVLVGFWPPWLDSS